HREAIAQRLVRGVAVVRRPCLQVHAVGLLEDADDVRWHRVAREEPPLVHLAEDAGVEQQTARDRRGPVAGDDALRMAPAVLRAADLRGRNQRRALARRLLRPRERELVQTARLPRDAPLAILPRAV